MAIFGSHNAGQAENLIEDGASGGKPFKKGLILNFANAAYAAF
jgi:hypothetical protein